jgi:hypothetical protein
VLELTAASTAATAAPAPTMDFAAPATDPTTVPEFAVTDFCIVDGTILKDKELENREKKFPRPLLNLLFALVVVEVLVAPTA